MDELFVPDETENLKGEFEKDVEKFREQPKLYELLWKYKEIFGPPTTTFQSMSTCTNGHRVKRRVGG